MLPGAGLQLAGCLLCLCLLPRVNDSCGTTWQPVSCLLRSRLQVPFRPISPLIRSRLTRVRCFGLQGWPPDGLLGLPERDGDWDLAAKMLIPAVMEWGGESGRFAEANGAGAVSSAGWNMLTGATGPTLCIHAFTVGIKHFGSETGWGWSYPQPTTKHLTLPQSYPDKTPRCHPQVARSFDRSSFAPPAPALAIQRPPLSDG